MTKGDRIRTSLDIPAALHRRLRDAAERRGCSTCQLILRSIERVIEEESPREGHQVRLPLVPAAGRVMRAVSNDEAIFP